MRPDDYELLASGVLPAPKRAWPQGRPNGLNSLGVRYVAEDTLKVWNEVPVAELWQWLALLTFLDPSTIPLEAALQHGASRWTAGRLFQERVRVAATLVDAGTLNTLSKATDPKRSLVRLGDFRDWAQHVGLPLPAEFPSAPTKQKARRVAQAPDSAFLRLNDMIPGLLPFSAATLWRKVKAGQFPAPTKLSDAVTAWRRDEVEAWLVRQSQPTARERKTR